MLSTDKKVNKSKQVRDQSILSRVICDKHIEMFTLKKKGFKSFVFNIQKQQDNQLSSKFINLFEKRRTLMTFGLFVYFYFFSVLN